MTLAVTVILKVTSIVVESSWLVTVIVTGAADWVAVGVPVISPVFGLSESPLGSALPAFTTKPYPDVFAGEAVIWMSAGLAMARVWSPGLVTRKEPTVSLNV